MTEIPDFIPLSDQAVYHLSPGCKCAWASVRDGIKETVGITQQHPDCEIHPTPKERS